MSILLTTINDNKLILRKSDIKSVKDASEHFSSGSTKTNFTKLTTYEGVVYKLKTPVDTIFNKMEH